MFMNQNDNYCLIKHKIEHKNTEIEYEIKLCIKNKAWVQESYWLQTGLLTIEGFDYKRKGFLKEKNYKS